MYEGEFRVKTKPILKLPEGVFTASVEASRGEFGVFLISGGQDGLTVCITEARGCPWCMPWTPCGRAEDSDLIAIGGTMDFVIPDIDR